MIRLLKRLPGGELTLVPFDDEDPPPYAILSHTWTEGQEVTYSELVSGTGKDKSGYAKIEFCVDRAAADDVQYTWVDTCCIDKSDQPELNTAITSMFRWYRRATKCYALLSDVRVPADIADPQAFRITWEEAFRQSRWFRRGWTLQKLLAPPIVEFFSSESRRLGTKIQLEQEIHEITRIPTAALRLHDLSSFSVDERMGWAANRMTQRKEDKVYCLLGIFGVYLVPNYGEGEEYATIRLKEEIQRRQEGRGSTRLQDLTVSSLLPFLRNEHFVGRESQLQLLEQFLLSDGHQRIAVCGLGGCGKSALAIEFAYRVQARGGRLVLWVPAISRESFELAYREIGTRLRIPGINDDNADTNQLVKNRLSSDGMDRWLMIVDNTDDSEILLGGPGSARLYDYIPHSSNGMVVFTTRNMKAAGNLTASSIIELSDMSEEGEEARQLLERQIRQPSLILDKKAVDELLHELAHLPLALVQAAAFMNNNGISASDYVSIFREAGNERELFGERFEDHSRYREMDSTVAKTWYISFDQIRKQDALAAEYLSFMACIDRASIPQSLLPPGGSRVQQLKAIGTLKGYAFIAERQRQEQESEKSFDMHRLVHMASAWWLEAHNEQTAWISKAAAQLEELVPNGGHEGREVWTAYLPHAIYMARPDGKLDDTARASLLNRVGRCQASLGQYSRAETTHRQVLSLREQTLGKEHSKTLMSMNEVGEALNNQGKYEAAEAMHKEASAQLKKVLGAEHRETLSSMGNLASTYRNEGRWKEAEQLLMEVLEACKRALGAEHPYTLSCMSDMALTYENQGRWKEAEQLQEQVLEMYKRVLGEKHPHTLIGMANLASTYKNQGRLKKAEQLGIQVLEIRRRLLGAEHPATLVSMSNLALIYKDQSRWKEAEQLQLQVLEIFKNVHGVEHPNVLLSINNLASTYRGQDRWQEAEQLQVQVLETSKRVLGIEHPNALVSMSNLALTWKGQGKGDEAIELMKECVRLRTQVLGAAHPDTVSSSETVLKWESQKEC